MWAGGKRSLKTMEVLSGEGEKLSLYWGWRQNRGEHEDKQARASALIHPEGQSSSLSVRGTSPQLQQKQ